MLCHRKLWEHCFKELGGFWVTGHEFSDLDVGHCLDFNDAALDLPWLGVCISNEVDLDLSILLLLDVGG